MTADKQVELTIKRIEKIESDLLTKCKDLNTAFEIYCLVEEMQACSRVLNTLTD